MYVINHRPRDTEERRKREEGLIGFLVPSRQKKDGKHEIPFPSCLSVVCLPTVGWLGKPPGGSLSLCKSGARGPSDFGHNRVPETSDLRPAERAELIDSN